MSVALHQAVPVVCVNTIDIFLGENLVEVFGTPRVAYNRNDIICSNLLDFETHVFYSRCHRSVCAFNSGVRNEMKWRTVSYIDSKFFAQC